MWASFSLSADKAPRGASPGSMWGGNKSGLRTREYNVLVKRRRNAQHFYVRWKRVSLERTLTLCYAALPLMTAARMSPLSDNEQMPITLM